MELKVPPHEKSDRHSGASLCAVKRIPVHKGLTPQLLPTVSTEEMLLVNWCKSRSPTPLATLGREAHILITLLHRMQPQMQRIPATARSYVNRHSRRYHGREVQHQASSLHFKAQCTRFFPELLPCSTMLYNSVH